MAKRKPKTVVPMCGICHIMIRPATPRARYNGLYEGEHCLCHPECVAVWHKAGIDLDSLLPCSLDDFAGILLLAANHSALPDGAEEESRVDFELIPSLSNQARESLSDDEDGPNPAVVHYLTETAAGRTVWRIAEETFKTDECSPWYDEDYDEDYDEEDEAAESEDDRHDARTEEEEAFARSIVVAPPHSKLPIEKAADEHYVGTFSTYLVTSSLVGHPVRLGDKWNVGFSGTVRRGQIPEDWLVPSPDQDDLDEPQPESGRDSDPRVLVYDPRRFERLRVVETVVDEENEISVEGLDAIGLGAGDYAVGDVVVFDDEGAYCYRSDVYEERRVVSSVIDDSTEIAVTAMPGIRPGDVVLIPKR